MCVISIGTFDGIHLGHRKLLNRVIEIAKGKKLESVIVTYKDHPAFTLQDSAAPRMLCPARLKEEELYRLGIDKVEMLDFTPELSEMSAYQFLVNILIPKWHPSVIVVGYDSHFGKGRAGDLNFLREHQEDFHYELEFVSPLLADNLPISSTMIRNLLEQGKIDAANTYLGRPYRLSGNVISGWERGRTFGFPTANLALDTPHQLVPAIGIYLSRVILGNSEYFALTNIGKSPTVKKSDVVEIESYLIDFEGDIYGTNITVELLQYMREEKMFANTDELIQAMEIDLEQARLMIKGLQ